VTKWQLFTEFLIPKIYHEKKIVFSSLQLNYVKIHECFYYPINQDQDCHIKLNTKFEESQNSVHQKMKNKDKDRNIQELKRNRQTER
jgi:hypothetical protein